MKALMGIISSKVDSTGTLIATEFNKLPFNPFRFFTVSAANGGTVRGGHAHKRCHQLLFAISGEILCEVTNTHGIQQEFTLVPGNIMLHLEPGDYAKQVYKNENSILGVLASESYDADDYVYENINLLYNQ